MTRAYREPIVIRWSLTGSQLHLRRTERRMLYRRHIRGTPPCLTPDVVSNLSDSFFPIRICFRYSPTIVRQNLKVRQFAVQILTAETIKIWKFHTSQLLVCNQYASRWTLINILGLSSWPPPQCSLDISHIGIVCCVHFRPQILCSCIVLFVKVYMLETAACVYLSYVAYNTVQKTNKCGFQCYCRNWNTRYYNLQAIFRRCWYRWSKSHRIRFVQIRIMLFCNCYCFVRNVKGPRF